MCFSTTSKKPSVWTVAKFAIVEFLSNSPSSNTCFICLDITDKLISFRDKKALKDSSKVSHKQAIEKAENEYEKFRIKQDREYISSMDEMYKRYLEETNK